VEITTGKNKRAQKIIVYGPEGIGKSTFVSKFPQVIFSDVEGSTDELDVARFSKPTSWEMLIQQAQYLKNNPDKCRTWVIDTADWAEKLCAEHICSKSKKDGIEDFGYGKGYVYLEEEFGRFLNLCSDLLPLGINVVFTAHAQMRKFEQPDEMGAYDRWELKLMKKTAPLLKEWADAVIFANYKTYVVKTDDKKNKAQGGKRVMYTTHHSCWDAKNRYGLPDELPFEFAQIAHCFPSLPLNEPKNIHSSIVPLQPVVTEYIANQNQSAPKPLDKPESIQEKEKGQEQEQEHPPINEEVLVGIPKALADLMKANNVLPEEIQKAVADKRYYPFNTPISNYDPQFINGVLIAAWPQVFTLIQELRKLPF
jgi:GTPase SAR1 family protein